MKDRSKEVKKKKGNRFYSFLRGLIWLPVHLLYPVKVYGKENLPLPEKVVTVSNHLSALDVVLVAVYVKGFRHIIAKKELTKSKFFARAMDKAGAIPIDRGKADLSAMRKVMTALGAGEGITIFPEGTRNKTGGEELQEVKSGAALFALKGGAEVVPIMILHKQRIFRRNYIIVGAPRPLTHEGGRVDSAAVERGAAEIEERMKEELEALKTAAPKKRPKKDKKDKKGETGESGGTEAETK